MIRTHTVVERPLMSLFGVMSFVEPELTFEIGSSFHSLGGTVTGPAATTSGDWLVGWSSVNARYFDCQSPLVDGFSPRNDWSTITK